MLSSQSHQFLLRQTAAIVTTHMMESITAKVLMLKARYILDRKRTHMMESIAAKVLVFKTLYILGRTRTQVTTERIAAKVLMSKIRYFLYRKRTICPCHTTHLQLPPNCRIYLLFHQGSRTATPPQLPRLGLRTCADLPRCSMKLLRNSF
jgi:hypothetical protein